MSMSQLSFGEPEFVPGSTSTPHRLAGRRESKVAGTFCLAVCMLAMIAAWIGFTHEGPSLSPLVSERIYTVSVWLGALEATSLVVVFLRRRIVRLRWPVSRRAPVRVERSSMGINVAGPILASVLFLGISGVMLVFEDASSGASRITSALTTLLGFGWALLVGWAVTGLHLSRSVLLDLPSPGTKAERYPASALRKHVPAVSALAILWVVLGWTVVAPLSTSDFRIDGELGEWANVPGRTDRVNDTSVVASGPSFSFTYPAAGEYEATLDVTDSGGASNMTRVSFVVPNFPPVAEFSKHIAGLSVTLDASSSYDRDGTIGLYRWELGDGNVGSGMIVNHSYFVSGTYNVTLTAVDTRGAETSLTDMVTVEGPNRPPVPLIESSVRNFTIEVSAGRSYDFDGAIASVLWDFGDGATSTSMDTFHTYVDTGAFVLSLVLTDDDGASVSQRELVRVPNPAPSAVFTVQTAGLTVFCDARNSTDNGEIVQVTWSFGDGSRGSGPTVRHQYAYQGSFAIAVTVRDDQGSESSSLKTVRVSRDATRNYPPVARFSFVREDFFVSFEARESYDPDGAIVGYFWDFGDGNTSSGTSVSHLYERSAFYTVRLTVIDDGGAVGTAYSTVDLREATNSYVPPLAQIVIRVTSFTVLFEAQGSTARSGSIVKFLWTLPDVGSSLDLTAVKVVRQDSSLFLYAEVGDHFPSWNETTAVVFYIQTSSENEGYPVGGILANFQLRIPISSGHVEGGELLWYFFNGPVPVFRSWQFISSITVAGSGTVVEARVSLPAIFATAGGQLWVTCAIESSGVVVDLLDGPVAG